LEEILKKLPEKDPPQLPLLEYNYNRFTADILHHSEFTFYFRSNYYFIDYWKKKIKIRLGFRGEFLLPVKVRKFSFQEVISMSLSGTLIHR